LKKFLIILLIGVGVLQFYFKKNTVIESTNEIIANAFSDSGAMKALTAAKKMADPITSFECDGRQHCSQMSSYQEAKYFLQHCPNTKMDGDNDGIPCERQFNK
jgi:hypothetical protein